MLKAGKEEEEQRKDRVCEEWNYRKGSGWGDGGL